MSDFGFPLQTAIYAALTGASPVIAGGRIYDDPPQAVPPRTVEYPYVEIGETQVIPDDTSGNDAGISEFVDLHIWSTYRGMKEVKEIAARIHDVLHEASLTVVGRTSAFAFIRNKRTLRDPDGVTRHGIVTVEIIHRS